MNESDAGPPREHLEPADSFALLGDETRLEIVRTLAEWDPEQPPTFAELRRSVGVDDPGRFNYHLGRLRGQFLVKEDGTYRTTYAGEMVHGALVTGTFTERVRAMTTRTDYGCPFCGASMTVRYADGQFSATCPTHGRVSALTFPPRAATEREIDGLVELADLEARRLFRRTLQGVCPECWAALDEPNYAAFDHEQWATEHDESPEGTEWRIVLLQTACGNCNTKLGAPVEAFLALSSAVVAFFDDHGVDLLDRHAFELHEPFDDGTTIGRNDAGEPVGVTATATLDGERLTVELDGCGQVVGTDRERVD